MMTSEEYLNYIIALGKPFVSLEKEREMMPPLFEDLFTTVTDFNFYFGELRKYQRKIVDKKDITIISVKELLTHELEEGMKEWLRRLPPDELLLFDTSRLGTKIRRAFENTLFRVSIYRDNVVLVVNELGYFWLREEPRYLLPSILGSRRILLFPELYKALKRLEKSPLRSVLELRNKITHKTHLKIKLQLEKGKIGQSQKILAETYESSSPLIRALERRRGKVKTIHDYITMLEDLYPVFADINKKLADYYRTKYDPEKWKRNLDKFLKPDKDLEK